MPGHPDWTVTPPAAARKAPQAEALTAAGLERLTKR
jgi:hypothetical protein